MYKGGEDARAIHEILVAPILAVPAAIALAVLLAAPVHADAVIDTGAPESCTTEAAANALSNAVAAGGVINFNRGSNLVTITVNTNATDKTVVVNGGGLVRLSGDKARQIFQRVWQRQPDVE